ncbi:MAG: glycine cleavage system aminomethyltransferase GcvT [Candidatus Lernaella stagnicola]|nr:glycine cleavage system aminomethyltransferase GcvT [Candidatus Lernaella stagnicola]
MSDEAIIDFLFDENIQNADSLMNELLHWEEERQARHIVLIPSESICAWPVRRMLDTCFTNLYAEGYPARENTLMPMENLSDIATRLVRYRRYADRRFYKGNAYVNLVESICRTRAAECFATEKTPASKIHANVQPLSGAPANIAVYEALVPRGGTVMALDLMAGGHLSHGSPFHMTGKHYHIVPYGVDPQTELIDYDEVMRLAKEHRPKMIIAGYTSYPWAPDFAKFRAIADEVGAYLMADIAHPAGLTVAGDYPNPIDHAHVVTFTTHKTLMGPRGAVILTSSGKLAAKIHNSVFPGEQGGPHMNTIAALAVAFKLAQTDSFRQLMHRIAGHAKVMAEEFQRLGVRLAYGGTDTHKLLIDLKPLTPRGTPLLYGEPAAHILELAGIILNKNTIPGDTATPLATGLRLGTPWVTQRGADAEDVKHIARLIHRVITAIHPVHYDGMTRVLPRGKIDLKVLREVSEEVDALTRTWRVDAPALSGYPHHPYLDHSEEAVIVKLTGAEADEFLREALVTDPSHLADGEKVTSLALDDQGNVLDEIALARLPLSDDPRRNGFVVKVNPDNADPLLAWLRGLADGFTMIDPQDASAKVTGAVVIDEMPLDCTFAQDWLSLLPKTDKSLAGKDAAELNVDVARPFFVGQSALADRLPQPDLPRFSWNAPEGEDKRTTLFEIHQKLGGVMVPFGGYEMPVRYTSTIEEHNAVRQAAGLFDVSHMGVFEASGPRAMEFVDLVCANHAGGLEVGEAQYSHLFDHDGDLLDDLLVYHVQADRILLVVNAANEDKDWAWLVAVNEGRVLLDPQVPQRCFPEPCVLRNLKDPQWGDERRVDLALQGPRSRDILLALAAEADKPALKALGHNCTMYATLDGLDAIISGTGYTGEPTCFEIFVHPDKAPQLWEAIMEAGKEHGVMPIGLGARDSLRMEAGLPLYGHELAGPHNLVPNEAGFGGFVKLHKPFFVGKKAYLAKKEKRGIAVVRFGVSAKGTRPLKTDDPIVNDKGACIGYVTSCATDGEGKLIGQAFVQARYAKSKTLQVIPAPKGRPPIAADEVKIGQRLTMPVEITILGRFLRKKK